MKLPSVYPRRRRARKVLSYAAVVLLIIFADSFYEARVIVLRGPAQAYAICSNRGYFTVQLATDLWSEKKCPWEMRCDVPSTWRTEGPRTTRSGAALAFSLPPLEFHGLREGAVGSRLWCRAAAFMSRTFISFARSASSSSYASGPSTNTSGVNAANPRAAARIVATICGRRRTDARSAVQSRCYERVRFCRGPARPLPIERTNPATPCRSKRSSPAIISSIPIEMKAMKAGWEATFVHVSTAADGSSPRSSWLKPLVMPMIIGTQVIRISRMPSEISGSRRRGCGMGETSVKIVAIGSHNRIKNKMVNHASCSSSREYFPAAASSTAEWGRSAIRTPAWCLSWTMPPRTWMCRRMAARCCWLTAATAR
jgi:hypothetical protein